MKKILLASVIVAVGALNVHAADFGGAYVGGDVSYSKTGLNQEDATGFQGGVNAGYGILYDKWYIGGEIGGGFAGIDGESNKGTFEKKSYYTGVARLGYKATDKIMAYGILGLEGGNFENGTSSDSDWGFRYGVGVEGFVKDNISLKAQIDYVDWQGENANPGKGEWRVGTGLNYHF